MKFLLAVLLCLAVASAAPTIEEDHLSLLGWEFPKDFPWYKFYECYFNILGDVSKANRIKETWSQYQPEMKAKLDAWKKCVESGDKSMLEACNKKEGRAFYKSMEEYMLEMVNENQEAAKQFVHEAGKCNGEN